MYSSAALATDSGPNKSPRRTTNGPGRNHSEHHAQGKSSAAGVHFMVARGRALLSPAGARGGRGGLAVAVLGRDRRWVWYVIAERRHRYGQFPELFLSRRADDDCALYLDLHHDVSD